MNSRRFFLILLFYFSTGSICTAQQKTIPIVEQWRWFQKQKDVTGRFPTNYKLGGVYRLKKDVVVECGGTDSRVSEYWVNPNASVEQVKEHLRDPKAAKEREVQSLQSALADKPLLSTGLDLEIWRIRHRRETRSLLSKRTMVRFRQIWLARSFEMGVLVHAYVEVLDGCLLGKWLDVFLISDCAGYGPPRCNVSPEYLVESVGK